MNLTKQKVIEPYTIFFPFSIFGGIAGVSLWIFAWVVQKKWIDYPFQTYPMIQHISIMVALFLLPATKGFVFTAIPRFTGTSFLTKKELGVLSFIQIIILFLVFFFDDSIIFYSFQTIDFVILFLFILHRFRISKGNLSGYLHFLSGGFFLGLLGSIFQLASMFIDKNFLFLYGKDFIFYGMIPCIIFGVGTRIIPMIINADNPTKRMEWVKKAESQKIGKWFLILFIASFIIEIGLNKFMHPYGLIFFKGIRFILCSFWIINFFHIFEISNFKGKLPRTILFACYMFILGYAGYSFGLNYSPHLVHLYLIGGLSLLVLSIMTRVVLSHGGGDMTLEKNSNAFYWIIGIIFIAAITRASVYLLPALMMSHLAYAAISFMIVLVIWFFRIGSVIFK